ncbi:MAG: Rieske 2Fe-2S domain-containing protein [Gammaproteobacteria bacterium]
MQDKVKTRPGPFRQPYAGYHLRHDRSRAEVDVELTHCGPGTPMGETMRRAWQPVCLSEELTDVPKAIRIMNEDLVAFRDRGGRVGVLARHCPHRGASLEFGIVQERGIRCCYHAWQFDVDGSILEMPCEPADSRMKDNLCIGAYPAFERHGLVFAYLGDPATIPPFDEFDAYHLPAGGRLVAFSNIYPCNWLQVHENLVDHFHAAALHNNMTVASVDRAISDGVSLGQGFRTMPLVRWETTRDGHGLMFAAARRVNDDRVWIRITEMTLPNLCHTSSVAPSAAEQRHTTVGMTRWHVPVDDHHMISFGWRHFNDEIDPAHFGREDACGVDRVDFLAGQVGDRSYREGQLAPGDFEAITSIGTIAPHSLEHPGHSDLGVNLCRSLLRRLVRGETPPDTTRAKARAAGDTLPLYSCDSVLHLPRRDDADDAELLSATGRRMLELIREIDALPSGERQAHMRRRLDELDGGGRV